MCGVSRGVVCVCVATVLSVVFATIQPVGVVGSRDGHVNNPQK